MYSEDTADKGRGYDDLLKDTNIKAVVIALPILVQPDFVKKALKAGKHVLSEKPIAKDVDTARALIKWFEEGGEIKKESVTWGVAENFRYLDSYRKAAEEGAKLGRVLGFRLRMNALVDGGKYFGKWSYHP